MENKTYKNYVRSDERGCITYGFTEAFEQPQDADILHNEHGARHFQLCFADGSLSEPNPPLTDAWGVLLYRLVDGFAQLRSPEELEADRLPPDSVETKYTERERIDYVEGWMEGSGYEPS